MSLKMVVLRDGDELAVIAQINGPSVFDPADQYGGVTKSYRIVAVKSSNPIIELVPLTKSVLVTTVDIDRAIEAVRNLNQLEYAKSS